MKFSDSGLPQKPVIEAAFKYSYAHVMSHKDAEMKELDSQLQAMFDENLRRLNAAKSKMTEDEYRLNKERLDKQVSEYKKIAPMLVAKELDKMFRINRLPAANEAADHTSQPSDDLIAATLLVKCVRSPVDYINIEKTFGKKIATMVADVNHMDAYPGQRHAYMQTISDDSKICYATQVICSMNQIALELPKALKAGMSTTLEDGQEQATFEDLQLLWGLDKKLDARFVETFNRLTRAIGSPFEIRVNAGGKPELADRNKKPSGPRPPSSGDGSIGGPVF